MATAQIRKRQQVVEGLFLRAMDGDTILVLLDLGYGVHIEKRIRLACVESWELGTEHDAKAKEAASWIERFCSGHRLTIHPCQGGPDKYGRLRARVLRGETDLAEALISSGRAWRVPPSHTHARPDIRAPNTTETENHHNERHQ